MENINRETWLNLMIDKSVPLFDEAGFKISDIREKLKASCSVMVGMRKSKNLMQLVNTYQPNGIKMPIMSY